MTVRGWWTRVASFGVLALFVVGWQWIADLRLVSPVFLPSPSRAWSALVAGVSTGDLVEKIIGTLAHMAFGWLAASAVGVGLGALIGVSAWARAYIAPTLEFLRPLPASAVIPVGIALFGLSQTMAIGVIAFGATWPMLLGTIHGVATVEPRLVEVARGLRLSRTAFVFKIALPNAMPDILSGLRLGLTVSLILAVVCEMLAGLNGLGNWILLSARSFRSADLYAGVIVLGVIGYVTAVAIAQVERWVLRWR